MSENKISRREKILGFILANIESENFKILTNSFGQRYLFLKETNKEETEEFKNLKILFDSLHVFPIFDAEKGVVFKMEEKENKESNNKRDFFNRRKLREQKEEKKGEIRLINDIFFDIREELKELSKIL